MTHLSDWAVGTAAPTAVRLSGLAGRAQPAGIALHWQGASDLLGFNVYRSGTGRLNRTLITSLTGRPGEYVFLDRGARAGVRYTYRLQVLELSGTRTWLGRIVAKR